MFWICILIYRLQYWLNCLNITSNNRAARIRPGGFSLRPGGGVDTKKEF